ncbi:type I-E CRISPR-associated protein Cas7/Cse4/CasC [Pseudonocardia oroxyli]|uniref:CRISPR-associated protein, Cse4 family n=1 Tax=Pseudonocardia oroxyli TaxID=366584 RepID=A0A1G8AFN9_PSEOR|nr:type I-E CRISPR-associated protein Cas7/Cse4/CasC [Pseudonocardia oroxyli]SDH19709.1 CRISPR-associated protein, Cse4 family [Pseudonocardia oroxyli]
MSRTVLDLHVLQTVPPSNLNRDDTGSPKTARFGGVVRARVSSQAWKRATRTAFERLLDASELGVRTKRLAELVGEEITRQDPALVEQAPVLAKQVLEAVGIKISPPNSKKDAPEESGYLVFLSNRQVTGLAELAVEATRAGEKPTRAEAKKRADTEHSVDVALFGRMVAEATDLNVDAAAQVAHAISVHGVQNEFDYFTAVDDHKNADDEEDAGAGMIGTVEFNSSTLYRYATVDVDRLADNLGDAKATQRAVEAFVRAFVMSMPTGKQNTFAHGTLPDAVLVMLRDSRAVNLVGAFEETVEGSARIATAIARLATHAREIEEAYADAPVAAWTFGPGERIAPLAEIATRGDIASTVTAVGDAVAARLA